MEDEREGHAVCVECGLVMEPIYLHPPGETNDVQIPLMKNIDEKDEGDLLTLCDKLQLCPNVTRKVLEAWEPVKKWHAGSKKHEEKHSKRGLMVMVVYQSLIEQNIPRPISHLCQEAGLHPKTVWHWTKMYYQKNDKDSEKMADPLEMCEYFLKPLNLSFRDIKEIKKMVSRYETLSFAPKTLMTACAYVFLRRKKEKSEYSIQKIAKLLGVSVMSVYRCHYALKEK